jgi:hypothetical protein
MAPQAAGSASKPQTSIAALNAGSTYITTFHVYHNMHPQLLPEIRRVPPYASNMILCRLLPLPPKETMRVRHWCTYDLSDRAKASATMSHPTLEIL